MLLSRFASEELSLLAAADPTGALAIWHLHEESTADGSTITGTQVFSSSQLPQSEGE